MVRIHVLETHTGTVQGGVRDDLDGRLVLDNGRDAGLSSSSCHGIGASGTHSQCNNTNGPADGHAREHVSLAGAVSSPEPVEVPLNDVALLAGIMDGGRCQTNANDGNTGCQGEGKT
jgi:hypothetical protein